MAKRSKKVLNELAKSFAEPKPRRGRPHKISALEKKCIMECVDKALGGKKDDIVIPAQMDREKLIDALKRETTGQDWSSSSDNDSIRMTFPSDDHVDECASGGGCLPPKEYPPADNDSGEFRLSMSTAKLDTQDIPEYVLNAFILPPKGFSLESNVNINDNICIEYRKDSDYFAAVFAIAPDSLAWPGRRMEVHSRVTRDGATYSMNGIFCDSPHTVESRLDKKTAPRACRLYDFLRKKLGLD
jgi:hypothetical protein